MSELTRKEIECLLRKEGKKHPYSMSYVPTTLLMSLAQMGLETHDAIEAQNGADEEASKLRVQLRHSERAEAEASRYLHAINWAMGCNGSFRAIKPGEGPFYWRTELAERACVRYSPERECYLPLQSPSPTDTPASPHPGDAVPEAVPEAIHADAMRYRYLRDHYSSHYPMTPGQPAEWSITWDFQQRTPEQATGSFDHWIDCDIARLDDDERAALASAPPASEPHQDDQAVDRFAEAMKRKLADAREKGRGGWDDPERCTPDFLAQCLVKHATKDNDGTFEDVANFAMMLHQRGAFTTVLARAMLVYHKDAFERGWRARDKAERMFGDKDEEWLETRYWRAKQEEDLKAEEYERCGCVGEYGADRLCASCEGTGVVPTDPAPDTPRATTGERQLDPAKGPLNSRGDYWGVCPHCEESLEERWSLGCPSCSYVQATDRAPADRQREDRNLDAEHEQQMAESLAADRPEPSEALAALDRIKTPKCPECGYDADRPKCVFELGGECPRPKCYGMQRDLDTIRRAISQPVPAVPDDREQSIDLIARIIERHEEKPPGPADPPFDYQPEWIRRTYRRRAERALADSAQPAVEGE